MQRIKSYCHLSPTTPKKQINNKLKSSTNLFTTSKKQKTHHHCCQLENHKSQQKFITQIEKNINSPIQQKVQFKVQNNNQKILTQTSPLNPQTYENQSQKILKQVISKNQKYFKDKIKVCCTVKPSQYKLQLPSRTGRSIYKQDYLPKSASTDLFIKYEPYSPKYPPNFQTSYNFDYIPHALSPQYKRQKQRSIPKDGPTFMQTHYKGNFKNWGIPSNDIIQPINNYLFGKDTPFNGRTTYNIDYIPKQAQKTNVHIQQNYPIFTDIKMPKQTHYKSEYTLKKHTRQGNFKPRDIPLQEQGFNYETEYKGKYDEKKGQHCKYSKELSVQQLQALIMNL